MVGNLENKRIPYTTESQCHTEFSTAKKILNSGIVGNNWECDSVYPWFRPFLIAVCMSEANSILALLEFELI